MAGDKEVVIDGRTLKQIKEILLDHNCLLNIAECREKEWDFLSYRKWIVLKK